MEYWVYLCGDGQRHAPIPWSKWYVSVLPIVSPLQRFLFSDSSVLCYSDQIFKIFQRRGTPSGETWPAVLRLPHYNAEFPLWRERPITDFVAQNLLGGPVGVDLLNKLLAYDPDRRIACKAALQHPFFLQE